MEFSFQTSITESMILFAISDEEDFSLTFRFDMYPALRLSSTFSFMVQVSFVSVSKQETMRFIFSSSSSKSIFCWRNPTSALRLIFVKQTISVIKSKTKLAIPKRMNSLKVFIFSISVLQQ